MLLLLNASNGQIGNNIILVSAEENDVDVSDKIHPDLFNIAVEEPNTSYVTDG